MEFVINALKNPKREDKTNEKTSCDSVSGFVVDRLCGDKGCNG